MSNVTLHKLFPLLLVSVVWFAMGWLAHGIAAEQQDPLTTLSADQQQILTAHNLLLTYQLKNLTEESRERITAQTLAEAAIDGMLRWSHDPYADQNGSAAAARFFTDTTTTTGVPGYSFDMIDGQMVVVEVMPDTSAKKVGVQVGDILVSADGVLFDERISGNEASILQRGPLGSTLSLTVRRDQKQLTFSIVREARYMLSSRLLDERIGYLDLNYLTNALELPIKAALERLYSQSIDALIWDLRGNYGGSVAVTSRILSYFIAEGKLFTVESNDKARTVFSATGNAFLAELPVIILIDHNTVSAAEIAVAVMRERKHTIIIGQTTKGKGTVQDTFPLGKSYLLHFTVAKWLAPSDQWLHGIGITPTIEIKDDPTTNTDEVLDFAIEYIKTNLLQ